LTALLEYFDIIVRQSDRAASYITERIIGCSVIPSILDEYFIAWNLIP